jgi:SAM-dependent methyltransferase
VQDDGTRRGAGDRRRGQQRTGPGLHAQPNAVRPMPTTTCRARPQNEVMTTYAFGDNALVDQQMRTISETFDEVTTRILERTGPRPGHHCLEIGAGNGSVARILARLTGPGGHVLATDATIDHLTMADGVHVLRHDITRDPLPESTFDLVHARLVVMHLPDRRAVLDRLVRALKPGGWLVTEDYDVSGPLPVLATPHGEAVEVLPTVWRAFQKVATGAGVDLSWGRHAYSSFLAAGLTEVSADLVGWSCQDGRPGRDLLPIGIGQLGERMVSAGATTAEELDRFLALVKHPATVLCTPVFFSTVGRRPAG